MVVKSEEEDPQFEHIRKMTEKKLEFHMRLLQSKPFYCSACESYFFKLDDIKFHSNHKHKNSHPFPCSSCGVRFRSEAIRNSRKDHCCGL